MTEQAIMVAGARRFVGGNEAEPEPMDGVPIKTEVVGEVHER
jgi:hypothetical protein